MNQLTVDKNKCTGCGNCQQRCGFKKVIYVNGIGKATFKKDKEPDKEVLNDLIQDTNLAPWAYMDYKERKY